MKMASLGKFPTQVQYSALLPNPLYQNLQFASKPYISFSTRPNFHTILGKSQSGLCCNASKNVKNGGFGLKEMDGSDEFEEDFDDEFPDLEDDDDEFDEDEELVVPLKNMKQRTENKPRGFGEGKVYDTPVEDKLLEEIEQSRQAQLANVNKLKNTPPQTTTLKKTVNKDKGPTISQDGIRVRLVNLPKKKNIHKDLRLAFKQVPGIVNIVPVVSGNEKTRDPVCKGLAFVHFKNHDDAQRFIQNFSGKSISFGKVQKQIKCEMTSSNSDNSLADVPVSDSSEESVTSAGDDEDEMHVLGQQEEEEINGTSITSDSILAKELKSEAGEAAAVNSSSSKKTGKLKKVEKKVASRGRKDKVSKLGIPGSANKLKIRDREILSGVFSKYGAKSANATSTVKELSR